MLAPLLYTCLHARFFCPASFDEKTYQHLVLVVEKHNNLFPVLFLLLLLFGCRAGRSASILVVLTFLNTTRFCTVPLLRPKRCFLREACFLITVARLLFASGCGSHCHVRFQLLVSPTKLHSSVNLQVQPPLLPTVQGKVYFVAWDIGIYRSPS